MMPTQTEWPPRMAVCVGAVVLRDERVLWVRQAPGHPLAGQWTVPWGLVDPAETPEAAAIREAREEGGVIVEVRGLLGIQNLPTPGWLGVAFLCRHVAGEPVPDGIETDRAAFLGLNDVDVLREPLEAWSAWLVRRVLRGETSIIAREDANPFAPRAAFL